ncbi:laccase, multicopper oxidase, benzenediol:oxygen oxidorectuctase [Recurvomyces mirabilis]|uniref:laccase n=1 Tax=Recurvomyces mirabilis TaxID=574656 RepID=A0AAE0TQ45_9PEZI|nr:laccase, multicopper oxidase, benzenediol:oxygen oxidorectuctase [Recurvomyces mirabilis]KAK5149706.1 laccase, multicopper oxidase, benzenediol:oxygen oxidorectuctase [Recurvomyces mirabilis]
MRFHQIAGVCLTAFSALTAAAVVPAEVEKRATSTSIASSTTSKKADAQCTNGPTSRACWKNGYSIATDFDQKFPTTGKTVSHSLTITNGTCNPDGHGERLCLLINNQYPGPVVNAAWGDILSVTVTNAMKDNGTSIHWHGIRQYHSPGYDGVNGITECPLAPGQTKTYTFQVSQFGTSWYHAHFSSQYGDGVIGPIVLDGPASANYDEDLGPYVLNDWYYQTAYQINSIASVNLAAGGPPPNADNILINGTNKNANGGGQYNKVSIKSGKKYRLRLINMSVDNYIRVTLDNHVMQVMTSDFIPVKSFYTETLLVAIGQRYDVVITANQTAGSYWFRADVATDCLSGNNFKGLAVWTYDSVTAATPTSSAYANPAQCIEPSQAAPYWVQPVPSGTFQQNIGNFPIGLTQAQVVPNGDAIVVWSLGSESINVDWEKPTLQYVMYKNTSYPAAFNAIPTVNEGAWNYVLVQQGQRVPPVPHPFHLHGHDFFVLGQGSGTFDQSTASLNWATPPRRDTATVIGGGWLAIAFNSNNPGTWLMHCHIAWHVSEGLGLQFIESPDQITLPDQTQFSQQCAAWDKYYQTAYWKKDDSGI